MAELFRSALVAALEVAIRDRADYERQAGYTGDSALLYQWKDASARIQAGESLEIKK